MEYYPIDPLGILRDRNRLLLLLKVPNNLFLIRTTPCFVLNIHLVNHEGWLLTTESENSDLGVWTLDSGLSIPSLPCLAQQQFLLPYPFLR